MTILPIHSHLFLSLPTPPMSMKEYLPPPPKVTTPWNATLEALALAFLLATQVLLSEELFWSNRSKVTSTHPVTDAHRRPWVGERRRRGALRTRVLAALTLAHLPIP